jgi:HSP20 family molecular chaperone IbpA
MSRLSLFNSPLLLGFDQFERALDRVNKTTADGYPPYNVEQIGEDALRITLAVAGFTMDDLSVQVEDNQLVIRGKQAEEAGRVYLHRGIAARQFQRSFVLADGIEVTGAALDNGLLKIDLQRRAAEGLVRSIAIKTGKPVNGERSGS